MLHFGLSVEVYFGAQVKRCLLSIKSVEGSGILELDWPYSWGAFFIPGVQTPSVLDGFEGDCELSDIVPTCIQHMCVKDLLEVKEMIHNCRSALISVYVSFYGRRR